MPRLCCRARHMKLAMVKKYRKDSDGRRESHAAELIRGGERSWISAAVSLSIDLHRSTAFRAAPKIGTVFGGRSHPRAHPLTEQVGHSTRSTNLRYS
jgi:hypothetical protein